MTVAPFVGAWIEIISTRRLSGICGVAPFVGAWIEIRMAVATMARLLSLPSWERGLKSASV